jgi:hypothetical protein
MAKRIMSVEDRLSSIEQQYKKAYDMLSSVCGSDNWSSARSAQNISETIKAILTFQRGIELLYEDIKKLSDEKTELYIDRCKGNIISIRVRIQGSSGTCDYIDRTEYEFAFAAFRKVRSLTYQILEDVRLIYALRIYPIEEKMALKSALTDYGFVEVTKCLDEAETNLAEKHFKDSIDRSREGLEKTAASILVAEKKKPSGYFSTDVGTISGLGILDKETKKVTEATYSYLSEVGAHGRGEELTLGDAHYAIRETYMRIDVLLKRYAGYLSRKK